MGNSASSPKAKGNAYKSKSVAKKKADAGQREAAKDKSMQEFVERIFEASGALRSLEAGETLIEQGVTAGKMFFIKEGRVDLVLKREGDTDVELATRSTGDVLGELSLLLGHPAAATAKAATTLTVLEVDQQKLLKLLADDNLSAGQLFKVVATYLSERISELSGRMRSVVTKGQAPGKTASLPTTDISHARAKFGLASDQRLIGVYQCSVRREVNAVKEQHAHFGVLYIFDSTLCFDLKMFAFNKQMVIDNADIVSFLRSEPAEGNANTVEVQSKGQSVELQINEDFEEACLLMEACRLKAKTGALGKSRSHLSDGASGRAGEDGEAVSLEMFHVMLEPIIKGDKSEQDTLLHELDLHPQDWDHFLSVAKTLHYKKGEYVVQEGQASATLYQILRGALRVELLLPDQAQAVVVGYRQAGEMLGETSLLKEGRATASVAADQDTTVVAIEGRRLEQLFSTHPRLPSRFFCFLATYQAERLYKLTQSFAESQQPQVTISASLAISIEEVINNPAYCGVLRKYLLRSEADAAAASNEEERARFLGLLTLFDFYVYAQDYRELPDKAALAEAAQTLRSRYLNSRSSTSLLAFTEDKTQGDINAAVDGVVAGSMSTHAARQIFLKAQEEVLAALAAGCFDAFLGSSHYRYILELKAKENIVPTLDDFKVVRVLGEGGFGQVIDVVKRDCGVHYAMKVMQKEVMKQNLGSSWRKKIASEQQIMASLQHPFLVNLKYAFQNAEFLILVMDLVPSGDLSEFVLTKRRLKSDQVKWAIMETVEVMGYIHAQNILYRDLKPENLLVDEQGHVRLIDMGLAARVTERQPNRSSRVGTDCYMAPEVRWARRRRTAYGRSADWYTIGVLTYEFTHGNLPFSARDTDSPVYRGGTWPSEACKHFSERLLDQDHTSRLGSGKTGLEDVKSHAYFAGVDWDIVSACKVMSPMKGVKGAPKRKKDKETQAQRTAGDIAEADKAEVDPLHLHEYNIGTWNFVSPTAITEEYMESVYQCVSAI